MLCEDERLSYSNGRDFKSIGNSTMLWYTNSVKSTPNSVYIAVINLQHIVRVMVLGLCVTQKSHFALTIYVLQIMPAIVVG